MDITNKQTEETLKEKILEWQNLLKESKSLRDELDNDFKKFDKNAQVLYSLHDGFWLLVYGSFFGLSINLSASIIHGYFSHYKYYPLSILLLLWFSFYLLIKFITKRFNGVVGNDRIMKCYIENKDLPYHKKLHALREKFNKLDKATSEMISE
jgi:hypothetical protein